MLPGKDTSGKFFPDQRSKKSTLFHMTRNDERWKATYDALEELANIIVEADKDYTSLIIEILQSDAGANKVNMMCLMVEAFEPIAVKALKSTYQNDDGSVSKEDAEALYKISAECDFALERIFRLAFGSENVDKMLSSMQRPGASK